MTKQSKPRSGGCCKTILLLLSVLVAIIVAAVLHAHYEHPEPRLPIQFTLMSVMIKSVASFCRNFPFSDNICHVIHHGTGEVIHEIEHATITHLNVSSTSPEIEAGNVPVLVFTPKSNAVAAPGSPQANLVLMFLHGGGWVSGNTLQIGEPLINAAAKQGFTVVGVDYRLAPMFKAPTAVEDVVAAYQWALDTYKDKKIVVIGDSSGGNIAAALAVLVRNRNLQPSRLASQVLVYPVVTDYTHRATLESGKRYGKAGIVLDAFTMQEVEAKYNPNGNKDPRVNLLLNKDLTNLAPALVATAEYDILSSEGKLYASLLEDAGVKVQKYDVKGGIHGCLSFPVEQREHLINHILEYIKQL